MRIAHVATDEVNRPWPPRWPPSAERLFATCVRERCCPTAWSTFEAGTLGLSKPNHERRVCLEKDSGATGVPRHGQP